MTSNKIEQKCSDCSAFAMVFLRANHAGSTVLHMPLSNHGVSFNINLGLMNHETKRVYFLIDKL